MNKTKSLYFKLVLYISRHRTLLGLITIVALASFLRLYNLSSNVPALSQDEIVNGYDAFSIGNTLRDHHGAFLPRILGSFGDSASVALTYITIPFVLLLGLTDEAVRLPTALSGIGCVLLIYFLVKEVTRNNVLGLISALLMATSPWSITLTRWAIPPSIVPFFLLLFLLFFAKAVNKSKMIYFILAGITAGILTYSYPSAVVFTPVFITILSGLFLYNRRKGLVTILSSYAVVITPLFYLILFDASGSTARLSAVRLQSQGIELIGDVMTRYFEYFTPHFLFGRTGNNEMLHMPGAGNFLGILFVFAFVAICIALINYVRNRPSLHDAISAAKKHPTHTKVVFALVAWALLSAIPASITIDHEHVTRAIALLPLMTILLSYAAYYLYTRLSGRLRTIYMIVFVSVCLYGVGSYFYIYTHQYREVSAKTQFQYGVREGMGYVTKHDDKFKHVVIDANIHQAYIYYLFYSKYPPGNLPYDEINLRLKEIPYVVTKVNKYEFRGITEQELKEAKLVSRIDGFGQPWFRIYESDDSLYLYKTTSSWAK